MTVSDAPLTRIVVSAAVAEMKPRGRLAVGQAEAGLHAGMPSNVASDG